MNEINAIMKALETIQHGNEQIQKNIEIIKMMFEPDVLLSDAQSLDPGRFQIEFDPTDQDSKYAVMGIVQDMIEQQDAFEDIEDDEE